MKFPYGISHFVRLISDDYVYVDRADRIAWLEANGLQLVFVQGQGYASDA